MKPASRVVLFGGLGNQLFQYTLFCYLRVSGVSVELVYNENDIRKKQTNNPDLSDLIREDDAPLKHYSRGKISEKFINLILRLTSPRNIFLLVIYRVLQTLLSEITKIVNFDKRQFIGFSNPGYNKRLTPKAAKYFIGYFQTFRWASIPEIKSQLQKLTIVGGSSLVDEYSLRAASSHPLVVHIRIGDYLAHPRVGILDANYYLDAIGRMWSTKKYTEVWVFSDSPELAKEKISSLSDVPLVWVNPSNASPSEVLEIMRLGSGYVLSNSTFGWWGAFLSKNQNPKVIIPRKWFKHIIDPIDICPEAWERTDSIFEKDVESHRIRMWRR
jgi:hypothetical protein